MEISPMDLDTMLARFDAEYLEPNSISHARRHQQRVFLRRLAETLEHPLAELRAADVNAFLGMELKRGIHPNTGRKYVGMLRSFANWGEQAHVLHYTDELKSVRNPRGSSAQNPPRPYAIAEIAALQAAVAERYPALPARGRGSRALNDFTAGRVSGIRRHLWRHARRLQLEAQIALALELGLRRIEILNMTLAALHHENEQVIVVSAKQAPGRKRTRAVPYTEHARLVVREWLELRALLGPNHDSPWLTLPQQGSTAVQTQPQTFDGVRRALIRLGGWGWHRLRHTAATEWLRAGVPLEKVRVYMGHASIEQTLAYTEILDQDVDAAFGAAEAAFAKRLGLA